MPNHETAPGDNPNTDNPNPDNPWYDFNAPDSIEDYATPEPQSADVSTDALTPAPGSPNQPQQSHEDLALKVASKLLSNSSFDKRHSETVNSSLDKAKRAGEKFTGSGSERRNNAYLSRIEDMVDRRGTRMEKRLLELSAAQLVAQPENIPDSYWTAQEQILRDNGQARELSSREKEILTRDIQRQQRESLKPWVDYLSHEDCPFPTWFKVYAFDGMSRMATFDKEKRIFHKRDASTVAPFPHLDAAVLGKTYDAIADFYNLNQADFADQPADSEASKDRDAELEALVRSGNFNKLYSKFLLEKRVILKTPERAEDVHGAWREYLPGDEEALAKAADGTPWCVASPAVGKNYLETGRYGEGGYHSNYSTAEAENKAKFILFHLQDSETGMLAENACASIRLDTDGRVAEISGLNDGQALEDALVPEVEAKVRTLPGGERFLEAFADKQHLIAMDRKMQAGEYDFSQEDLEFIFEQKRKIVSLDTYGDGDPRIKELREYVLQDAHFVERYPEGFYVGGDLDLAFANIAELPKGLAVGGYLNLYSSSVTELPEGLSVGGDLYIRNAEIAELPEGLSVGGDLDLRDTNITKLPKHLSVGKSIISNNSKNFMELSEDLDVDRSLRISLDLRYTCDVTELPEGLSVGGYLNLYSSSVTRLPEGLSVGGDLNICNTEITELPEGLSVGGDLDLRDTNIAKLPKHLSVGGSLDLYSTKITELSEGLSVGGDLFLRNTKITKLPEGLSVGGNLDFRGTKITELPEGLRVGGSLDLYRTKITELPEGLSVGGNLDLRDIEIAELPEGLSVGGYLDLRSTNITKLPEGLHVGGDLNFRDTKITELPEELSVGGRLVALWDTDITKLPKRLSVGGDLDLRDTQITELSEELHVGGDLDLRRTQITELPENLSVGGGLNLRSTDIAKLPDGLTTVNGDLDLYLSKVTELPEGLSVSGNLDLRGTEIMELPEGLSVGGGLDLSLTNIAKLPEGIATVNGDLSLQFSQVTELPEGLSVSGNLDLRGINIAELPAGLNVGGDLDLRGTNIAQLPEDLHVGGRIVR